MKKIVLATKSPRRIELLTNLGFEFEICPSSLDESTVFGNSAEELVVNLASAKAKDIYEKNEDCVVIGADTVVVHNGVVMGKPKDEKDACDMLGKLSGATHDVCTGVSVVSAEKTYSFLSKTAVTFKHLTEQEIINYVKTGEPMDKAGAYGIQAVGAFLVEKISGDYYTVMGMPLCELVKVLEREFEITMFR